MTEFEREDLRVRRAGDVVTVERGGGGALAFTVEEWRWVAMIAGVAVLPPLLTSRQRESAAPEVPPAMGPPQAPTPRAAGTVAENDGARGHGSVPLPPDPLGEDPPVTRETLGREPREAARPAGVPPAIREAAERRRREDAEKAARAAEPPPADMMQLALGSLPSLLDR